MKNKLIPASLLLCLVLATGCAGVSIAESNRIGTDAEARSILGNYKLYLQELEPAEFEKLKNIGMEVVQIMPSYSPQKKAEELNKFKSYDYAPHSIFCFTIEHDKAFQTAFPPSMNIFDKHLNQLDDWGFVASYTVTTTTENGSSSVMYDQMILKTKIPVTADAISPARLPLTAHMKFLQGHEIFYTIQP